GGWVFDLLGIGTGDGLMGSLITALVGAILLLWVISLFKRA
ncbi:MAG TPA: GlsB/YeaQ/YmgE family stress response membrane protein, partial [Porphyromonadaceae bacterium]|nr:GlsB/YeaQ/YmgE family stress response membrane protein [Porphyromonadaceae bacterium]